MGALEIGLGILVTLLVALCFVGIYCILVSPKSISAGLKYGLLMGLLIGIWMGLGSYSIMPIPFYLALAWLIDFIFQMVVAGVITAAIIKEQPLK